MNKTPKISIVSIFIILIFGVVLYAAHKKSVVIPPPAQTSGVAGCYVATLAQDVYTLDIQSEDNGVVAGTLAFKNFEKDSSSGTFTGTLTGDILLGTYSFDSEGMHSNRQVIFKKEGDNFVEGFGDVQTSGDTEMFTNVGAITYDPNSTFVKQTSCDTAVQAPQNNITLSEGRQCYTYDHEATATEPYKVTEFIDMTIAGNTVTGTKTGTQAGPDMTNSYSGTITGTLENNSITDVYSYTVEGSQNKEQEIYTAGLTGIEKLRYPLIEQKGILVPDTTKPFTTMLYARVGCTASN